MWYDGFNSSRKRCRTSFVIPDWKIGDQVEHKVTGLVGTVREFATQGHELVKVRLAGQDGRRLAVIHAADLVKAGL